MKIAKPCTEDLDSMGRTASGGFACARCELDVVDLRRATRKRALTVLAELRAEGGRVCARVRARPDGTPLFRPDPPSGLARFAAPVALATTLAACSPSTTIARGATPITLAHESGDGDNANGSSTSAPIATGATVVVAPASRAQPGPSPGSTNVQPVEIELAGEMMW